MKKSQERAQLTLDWAQSRVSRQMCRIAFVSQPPEVPQQGRELLQGGFLGHAAHGEGLSCETDQLRSQQLGQSILVPKGYLDHRHIGIPYVRPARRCVV